MFESFFGLFTGANNPGSVETNIVQNGPAQIPQVQKNPISSSQSIYHLKTDIKTSTDSIYTGYVQPKSVSTPPPVSAKLNVNVNIPQVSMLNLFTLNFWKELYYYIMTFSTLQKILLVSLLFISVFATVYILIRICSICIRGRKQKKEMKKAMKKSMYKKYKKHYLDNCDEDTSDDECDGHKKEPVESIHKHEHVHIVKREKISCTRKLFSWVRLFVVMWRLAIQFYKWLYARICDASASVDSENMIKHKSDEILSKDDCQEEMGEKHKRMDVKIETKTMISTKMEPEKEYVKLPSFDTVVVPKQKKSRHGHVCGDDFCGEKVCKMLAFKQKKTLVEKDEVDIGEVEVVSKRPDTMPGYTGILVDNQMYWQPFSPPSNEMQFNPHQYFQGTLIQNIPQTYVPGQILVPSRPINVTSRAPNTTKTTKSIGGVLSDIFKTK